MTDQRSSAPGSSPAAPKPFDFSQPPFQQSSSYQVDATYWGNDQTHASLPYLIPPGARYGADIKVTIGNLFQNPFPTPTPDQLAALRDALGRAAGNADFALTWSGRDPLNLKSPDDADKVTITITIKAANAWKVGPAARQALAASYADIYTQVEALELGIKALIPGGAEVVAQRIAEALPVALDEVLFYRAGLNPGFGLGNSPFVDLQPGMRLRVDLAANQFVSPGSPLNGLVGSGQFFFAINRDNSQRIVFDTFLSAISAPQSPPPTSIATASGVIDLQAAGAARRYYRLFYPTQLPAPTAPGDARLTRNVTLVGADTLADLRAATSAYTQTGDLAAIGARVVAVGFRGRAIAVPEIGVYINRQVGGDLRYSSLAYVPVGTTLRQLLDQQAGAWNPGQLYGDTGAITLRRFWAEDDGVPKYRKVKLNPSRQTDIRVFDLPLAKSDILDIRFSMDS